MNCLPRKVLLILALFSTLIACSKSDSTTNTNNNQPPAGIKGTWKVDYYVVANIFAGGSNYNDTVLARHNESWVLTSDSITTDSWLTVNYDQTPNTPTFTITDTTEYIGTSAYTLDGTLLIIKLPTRRDTIYVEKLGASELVLHSRISPPAGFRDLYQKFSR